MEKHRHLFEKFVTFNKMYDGYILARQHKRYRGNVLDYSANLEENLIDAVNRLQWKMYKPGPLCQFYEYFPKIRLISAQPFYDRVINCAAYLTLWPIYERSFYEHSYGSIPGRGPIKAIDCLQGWMRKAQSSGQQWYMGKADVLKFFFRIPVDVQLRELGRPIDDQDMMWFLETAIRCDGRPLGLPLYCTDVTTAERIAGIGMQVGSLISQMTANVVLSPLDHYIKRDLKAPYYIRYMDDMLVMAPSKAEVWDILCGIDGYLRDNLGLQLNDKTAVVPVGRGIEYIGKRVWPNKVELRRSTTLQMKRHLRFVKEKYSEGKLPLEYCHSVMCSYLGLMKYCNNNALRNQLLEDFVLIRDSEKAGPANDFLTDEQDLPF